MARKVEINDPAQLERYLEGRERGEREGAQRARTQFRAGHARPRAAEPASAPAPAPEPAPAKSAQQGATVGQATAGASSLAPSSGGVWAVLVIALALTWAAVVTGHFNFGFFVAVLILVLVGSIVPIVGILIGGTALFYVVLTHGAQLINAVSSLFALESKGAQAASGGTA